MGPVVGRFELGSNASHVARYACKARHQVVGVPSLHGLVADIDVHRQSSALQRTPGRTTNLVRVPGLLRVVAVIKVVCSA